MKILKILVPSLIITIRRNIRLAKVSNPVFPTPREKKSCPSPLYRKKKNYERSGCLKSIERTLFLQHRT